MTHFDFHHTVEPEEIDAQGHVHNLRYLQWTLGAASNHSAAGGWNASEALDDGFGWVVRHHEIKYRSAAFAGDRLVIRTWISDLSPFASLRRYLICRPADRQLLAAVKTRWVYVDLRVRKAIAIPDEVASQISVCESVPPMPWEQD